MPFLKTSREKSTGKTQVGIGEAYSIWKMLYERYQILEQLLVLINYVHDPDFKVILRGHMNKMEQEVNKLEQLLDKYSIMGPRPNKVDVKAKGWVPVEPIFSQG